MAAARRLPSCLACFLVCLFVCAAVSAGKELCVERLMTMLITFIIAVGFLLFQTRWFNFCFSRLLEVEIKSRAEGVGRCVGEFTAEQHQSFLLSEEPWG